MRRRMVERPLGAATLVVVGLLAVACSSLAGEPNSSASAVGSATASQAPGTADFVPCQPMDLVLPSGESLDLTGSWQGNDLGPYQLRQWGDCLWFIGQNNTVSVLFFGHLVSDFTASGHWSTIAASDHFVGGVRNRAELYLGSGVLTLHIDVGAGGTNGDVSLTRTAINSDPDYVPGYDYGTTTWARIDDTPDHPVPGASP